MENNENNNNKGKIQPHYQRMLDLLELVGLDASDAYRIAGRSIYTYNAPDRMFGKTIAAKFKKALGFNPIYLRFAEGEPLLPNSPELVYKYKNNFLSNSYSVLHRIVMKRNVMFIINSEAVRSNSLNLARLDNTEFMIN